MICPGLPVPCSDPAQGICVAENNSCICKAEWTGSDCSILKCPGNPVPCTDPAQGTCTGEGSNCICNSGWTGLDCSTEEPTEQPTEQPTENPTEPPTESPTENPNGKIKLRKLTVEAKAEPNMANGKGEMHF